MIKNLEEEILPKKKEIIFKAVIDLCNEGKKIEKITIAEIAEKAGIGKGTVYEYFTNKEDIIQDALRQEMVTRLNSLSLQILEQVSFDTKIEAIFYWLEKNGNENKIFQKIMISKYTEDADEVACKMVEYAVKNSEFECAIQGIFLVGKQEEIIQMPKSLLSHNSGLMLFLLYPHFLMNQITYTDTSKEQAKKEIRDMFVKIFQN